jgi:FtsH-binding integral membrane protein
MSSTFKLQKQRFSDRTILIGGAGVGIFVASLLGLFVPSDAPKLLTGAISVIAAVATWIWGYSKHG